MSFLSSHKEYSTLPKRKKESQGFRRMSLGVQDSRNPNDVGYSAVAMCIFMY